MRRLVALLVCLCAFPAWALVSIVNDAPQHGGGGGGIAYVNSCVGSGAASATCTVDLTGANFLAITTTSASGGGDDIGTTYTDLGSGCTGVGNECIRYSYVSSVSGNVTFTATGCSFCVIIGAGYSGTIGSTLENTTGPGIPSASTNTCQTPSSLTPGHDNELVLFSWSLQPSGTGGTISVDQSFNIRQSEVLVAATHYGGALADLIQTTAGAVQPTWTLTGQTNSTAPCSIGSFQ